jgi:signal transduction histidine kinase
VTVTIARDEDSVSISCQDTGIGIPPEHLDRVFERFYQVNAARTGAGGRGTGLGLAIVKHAVAALGGAVKLDSQLGVGTTVTCTLPQHQPAVAA